MRRIAAAWVLVLAGPLLSQDGGVELRHRFEKGEKFPLRLAYSVQLKLDKIPDAFQGVVGEEPVNVKLEGLVQVEVSESGPAGATLEGTWSKLRAKGVLMIQDVDFSYDAEKKSDKPVPAADPAPGLGGAFNLAERLEKMTREKLVLKVDPLGKITSVSGTGRGAGELDALFVSLNGLNGPFPEAKVAKGGAWKGESKLGLPGLGGAVGITVRSDTAWEGEETVDGRACAVLRSKLDVTNEEGKKDEAAPFKLSMKASGGGEGKVHFAVKDGRLARSASSVSVRIKANANPGGGDEIDLEAVLKVDLLFERN
jgi:hypothetical protein